MEVTKVIEFDAGHRIPNHSSKCRNVHGHRYRVECTFEGPVHPARGRSNDGMVLDFGDLKNIMMHHIHDVYDHAFIVWEHDEELREALATLPAGHQTRVVHLVPTAENLAAIFFEKVQAALVEAYGDRVWLRRLRLFETPNSWADATSVDRIAAEAC